MAKTKKERLKAILDDLSGVGDIKGSAIISTDGLSIASSLNKELDVETFAAMTAAMQGAAETAVAELRQGDLEQIMVEAKKGKIITVSTGQDTILITLTRTEANLGLILLELGRASERITDVLEE